VCRITIDITTDKELNRNELKMLISQLEKKMCITVSRLDNHDYWLYLSPTAAKEEQAIFYGVWIDTRSLTDPNQRKI